MGLKEIRVLRGLSLGQLSEKSGVPAETLRKYECGQRDIGRASVDVLVSLSGALGCGMRMLVDGKLRSALALYEARLFAGRMKQVYPAFYKEHAEELESMVSAAAEEE